MKLVACGTCHAQYDVSSVDAKQLECRCGQTIEIQDLRAVDAKVHRCGACGAIVAPNAKRCDYCTASIVHDASRLGLICPECCARNSETCRFCTACGVAFDPQPLPSEEHGEVPCPCCGCLMPARPLDTLVIHECPSCHGVWAPADRFERLVQRAIDVRKQRLASAEPALTPRVSGATPTPDVKYRKCPVCDALMHRVNFRKRSGVIIDECRGHGTWLDADELEQIAGFILSGGLAEVQLLVDAEQAAARRREAARAVHAMPGLFEGSRSKRDSQGSLLQTVFELFELVLSR